MNERRLTMQFFVIYSFDIIRNLSVNEFKPPFIKKWVMTEDDSEYEYDYLADDSNDNKYRNGKHRKYYAELSMQQFAQFVDKCDLYMTENNTMGSISHLGHLPAFSFDNYYYDEGVINMGAYVTPLPELTLIDKNKDPLKDKDTDKYWEWIKSAMLNTFGKRCDSNSKTYQNFKRKYNI